MSLLLHEVNVRFGHTTALDRFSFEFPAAGIVALIGENGAGKSTALDVLSGFITPTSGEILESANRRHIGRASLRNRSARLHQANVLPPLLTPTEYLRVVRFPEKATWLVAIGGQTRAIGNITGTIPEAVVRMLDKASVEFHRPIASHSLGQQRTLALAATLIVRKPILLLDEPFSSLSDDVSRHASELIRTEAERRLVVFAEHDIPHAMELAGTVLVLKAGQLKTSFAAAKHHYSDLLQYFG